MFFLRVQVVRGGSSLRKSKIWRRCLVAAILLSTLSSDCVMSKKNEAPVSNNQKEAGKKSDPASIHERAIAIDMHADTTQRLVDEKIDLARQLGDVHFDTVR